MFLRLVAFELKQQVGGRVFGVVFAVSALMVAGSLAIDELRVGLDGVGAPTGRAAIVRVHLVWTLFHLFTAAALLGDAVLRDELHGFAPIVRATPVPRATLLLSRFAGGFLGLVGCYLSVPVALALGGLVLGEGTGPAGAYAFALGALALPNLFVSSALFFGLATATRSIAGCLAGAAALLVLYGLGEGVPALWEPFGFGAAARGGDALVANRALWVALGCGFVGLGLIGLRRERGVRPPPSLPGEGRGPAAERLPVESAARRRRRDWAPAFAGEVRGGEGWPLLLAQVRVRTRHEVRSVVLTPAFGVLLLLGTANAVASLWPMADAGSRALAVRLVEAFRLVPVVVALFFAGELYQAEREHRIDALIRSTPVAGAVIFLPKLLALASVLGGLAVATALAAAGVEVAAGRAPDLGLYLAGYALPKTWDWVMLGVLALFLQSVAPNKFAGWGFMVFFLIGSLALSRMGWTDPLYRYGTYPGWPVPPALTGLGSAWAYRLGWSAVAALLVAVACARAVRARAA